MTPFKQLINGTWTDAVDGGTWDVLNPATETVVETVPFGGAADCDLAIEAAHRAFSDWSRATPYERGAVLARTASLIRADADALARATTLEAGKPLAQARGEWLAAADLFEWFAEEGKRAYGRIIPSRTPSKRMLVLKQPLGVVGLITAWNFPAWNIARAGGAALAAGCTIVIRPSEFTPMSGMHVARLLTEAGAPAGVVNLVNGEPGPMGQAMHAHPAVAKIHFTGSTRVGKPLMDGASKTVTRLSLELGGNAPVLIFPDVDLEQVAAGAAAAKFRNGGQVCVSPQRFLVSKAAAPEFTERIAAAAGALRVGDGLDAETQVGPLINARQRDRVEALVSGARSSGAHVAVGGQRPEGRDKGYFYQPTVVGNLSQDAPLYREEIFGPVLPVSTFEGVDEAIAIANRTRYGLAAYVWTNHLPTALHVAERLEFGLVGVNEWTPQSTEAPFAGWKESGLGRESGAEGLEEYLETKLVAIGGVPR
ncbi:MAG TPA: NAD-dependent succinate-semialdehyde dehydrogenase [Vicinamibacterales bacterium]|nr:NAD-dependent succinate-semialdehyde dehydrogenase [Vicinamibacterales bacterium]